MEAVVKRSRDWLLLAVVAAIPRVINLGSESLWYDEAYTAWLAKLPSFERLFGAIKGDVHPPLWYTLEWVNARILGTSEFALRLPSAIAGIVLVLLVYKLALVLKFERRTALATGLLVAVLPSALYYSQEARVYSLFTCFALLALIGAITEHWLVFYVGCVGLVYGQNIGVLYVFALGSMLLVHKLALTRNIKAIFPPALTLLLVVITWLPWLPTLREQGRIIETRFLYTPIDLGQALTPIAEMTLGWRMDDRLALIVWPLAFAATGISLIVSRRWLKTRYGLLLLTMIFAAPLINIVASIVWKPVYLPRAFLPGGIGLAILWTYAMFHLSRPNRTTLRMVLLPAVLIGVAAHFAPVHGRANVRQALQVVQDQWQPGDVIFYPGITETILSNYYLPDKPYRLALGAVDLNQPPPAQAKADYGFIEGDFSLPGYRRAWLIAGRSYGTSQEVLTFINNVTRGASPLRMLPETDYVPIEIWLIDLERARNDSTP